MIVRRSYSKGLSVALFLLIGFFMHQGASSQEDLDLEREFFEDVGSMEEEYKDFERAAFEEFQREVRAMWQDFVVSTKKDWVEYSGDKTGRTRVDFETGEVQVEVLVPKEQAERDPAVVAERLTEEIERLVEDRGKNRDYPLPAPAEAKEPAPPEIKEPAPPEVKEPAPPEIKEPAPPEIKEPAPPEIKEPAPPEVKEPAPPEIEEPAVFLVPPKEIAPAPLLPTPVLEGQLQTKAGQSVTKDNKKEFAQEVLQTEPVKKEALKTEKGEMVKAKVTFALVPDHLRIRAEKYLASVRSQSGRFDISVPLAFAVMHTESYFNPKATSPVPAYGLMQLVPRSGARDAYKYVYGQDKILSSDYLYVPGNNVELGCAYLGLLKNRYFRKVKNPESALYCAVASYNTGPGNLSRTFVGKPHLRPAIERINTMEPEEVYATLRTDLPYEETREYVKRVRDRMSLYKEWE
jgi:membrane-bound lytic murein transglycosylase C